jgi:hypothetical protein
LRRQCIAQTKEKDACGELCALSVDARSCASIAHDALRHDAARRHDNVRARRVLRVDQDVDRHAAHKSDRHSAAGDGFRQITLQDGVLPQLACDGCAPLLKQFGRIGPWTRADRSQTWPHLGHNLDTGGKPIQRCARRAQEKSLATELGFEGHMKWPEAMP